MSGLNQAGLTPAQLRARDRAQFMAMVKERVDMMDAGQLQELSEYVSRLLVSELRTAAEGMVAAFDERPPAEPAAVTETTREAALRTAKQILGWPLGDEEEHAGPEDSKPV